MLKPLFHLFDIRFHFPVYVPGLKKLTEAASFLCIWYKCWCGLMTALFSFVDELLQETELLAD